MNEIKFNFFVKEADPLDGDSNWKFFCTTLSKEMCGLMERVLNNSRIDFMVQRVVEMATWIDTRTDR